RDHCHVLRHPRGELVAAGGLRGTVLTRPHGLRIDRRLYLRLARQVVRDSNPRRYDGRRRHVLCTWWSHRLGLPAHEWSLSCDLYPGVRGDRPYHLLDRGRRDRRHGGTAHRAVVRDHLAFAILLHGLCPARGLSFVHGWHRPLSLGTVSPRHPRGRTGRGSIGRPGRAASH